MMYLAKANQYIDDVLSGRIPACKWVRLACKRQKNDLARKGWKWRFDPAKAQRVCKFIEHLPHTKGEWAAKREPIRLEPWQCFILTTVFGWVDEHNNRRFQIVYVEVPRKSGKAEWVENIIPTPDGYKRMGDISPGDLVFGSDGRPVRVINVTGEMTDLECMDVTLGSGEKIIVASEHLWKVNQRVNSQNLRQKWTDDEDSLIREIYPNGGANAAHQALCHRSRFAVMKRADYLGVKVDGGKHHRSCRRLSEPRTMVMPPASDILETRRIADTIVYGGRNDNRYSIDVCQPIQISDRELTIPPYTFGAWLGDGTSSNGTITTAYVDHQIIVNIMNEGVTAKENKSSNDNTGLYILGKTCDKHSVRSKLRLMGVLNNKHIPTNYLRSSLHQRLSLLRGLMDTDGTICRKSGRCSFTNTNLRLAQDVHELVCSLGMKPTLLSKPAKLNGRVVGVAYYVEFNPPSDTVVFGLDRKAGLLKGRCKSRSDTRSIVSVTPVKSVPVKCIEVDAADGIYLTGRSFIPTHNSAISAGVGLYMLCADNEHGAEVYAGATTEKQAWEVFRPAKLMASGTPDLLKHYGIQVNASNVHILANGSRFEPLIGNPGDGSSPSCAIIDEFHEHDTPNQRDTMRTGMGARSQPLLWVITTAGDNLAGPCYDDRLTMQKVLEGVEEDDRRFGIIYTIDADTDWTTEAALRMANPNYDVSVRGQFLLDQQADAVRNSRNQGVFKTKHLNVWVQARSAAFNMERWASCYDATLDMNDFRDRKAWIGLDLASEVDIAAIEVAVEDGDGFIRFGKHYLPEETVTDPKNLHYQAWQNDGRIVVTDGAMIDFTRIYEDILEIAEHFNGVEVAFDPFQATMLVGMLMGEGITCVKYNQQVMNMSPAMKRLDALITSGKIRHKCDERHPMTWMMSNVTGKPDAKDNIYPRKERPENKIDGPVALMMAIGRAITGIPEETDDRTPQMFTL